MNPCDGENAASLFLTRCRNTAKDESNMASRDCRPFLDLPPCPVEAADAVILPLPLEKTISYGGGTVRAPEAILEASRQIELFDEETLVDFAGSPKLHTMSLLGDEGSLENYLAAIGRCVAPLRDKFVLAVGGEHTITCGMVSGLIDDPTELTIVQIDAHADLIDELDGRWLSHGTVMRRLWERGCRLVQIGVRSLSRSEYDLAAADERIVTFYAHQLTPRWEELLAVLGSLRGSVYLSVDVDGLDPAVIPSTGTPQPGGLSWGQTMQIVRTVATNSTCRLIGADIVEFVPSLRPPGCDLTAARLVMKILAFWTVGRSIRLSD